ncbi:MAG: hypothetical protein HY865_16065 [Chloroflexi bacterium]|nr:hypothetical protein [Chloroflexota bacterium]
MAVKSNIKKKAAVKPRVVKKLKPKSNPKLKPARKLVEKASAKRKSIEASGVAKTPVKAPASQPVQPTPTVVKRVINPLLARKPVVKRSQRSNQFSYMKAPGVEHEFQVGDTVEVFCDHEKSRERIRGWVKGIVVQVDYKMVAVQFRSNVYLTDGWMVPDRILWYPLNSEHIRPVPGRKLAKEKKDFIPDY